jgi:hypothetical protein
MNVTLIFGTDMSTTEKTDSKIANILVARAYSVEVANVIDATPKIIESFNLL